MDNILNDVQIKALVDHIRITFKYKDDPSTLCSKSRKTLEYILIFIWKREFNEYPTGKMVQALSDGILKKRPSLIPLGIQALIGTIQIYGNKSSHAQENFEELDATHAIIVEAAIGKLCNWFFLEYLNVEPVPDFNLVNQSVNAQASSYRELLSSVFSDGILELDEYEKILNAKESLGLESSQYEDIEKEIVQKYINKPIQSLVDLLKPSDLNTFKKKYEDNLYSYPEWVMKAIDEIFKKSPTLKYSLIFDDYLSDIQSEIQQEIPLYIKYLGCWQGWYIQTTVNQTKTFYDMVFVALSKTEFIGLTYEPLNPSWWDVPIIESDLLVASIHGKIENDIIISFEKEYLIDKPWQINYQAVVTEEGKFFEGDWEIGRLSGPFNAIKTRSLLPLHVFDIDDNKPITKIRYLDKLKNLTSTWFFQITGKDRLYGILHLIEVNDEVHGNILFPDEEFINISYINGNYDGTGNIILKKQNDILGESNDFILRFAADWSLNELNGTVKDDVHKIRAFKALKL